MVVPEFLHAANASFPAPGFSGAPSDRRRPSAHSASIASRPAGDHAANWHSPINQSSHNGCQSSHAQPI